MNKSFEFTPNPGCAYRADYPGLITQFEIWAQYNMLSEFVLKARELCRTDLFFLLYFALGIKDVNHPWIVDRINEVQDDHDETLDLWSREHFKSTILTFGLVVQEILNNPEERIGIFSHTRMISKAFLRRIKLTFETNLFLLFLFPDVLYRDAKSESPKWSEDEGIIVKRKGTYLESTIEAWGLVDAMPTSRHYTIRVYDDVVTKDSVSTPEQIKKTDEAFRLSEFLGARGGKVRVIGTRYHFADQYAKMKASGAWKIRERKGVTIEGGKEVSVFLTEKELQDFKKRVCSGNTYVYNCQMLLDPVAEEAQEFKRAWLRHYRTLPERAMNLYLFVDPASEKKTKGSGSDYTVMGIIGIDPMNNKFLVDYVRERLNLFEKWKALSKMMRKHPTVKKVRYEKYGMQADVGHFQHMMKEDGVYFTIEEAGGNLRKEDRIRRLVPDFENGKFFLPEALYSEVDNRDYIKEFIEDEYLLFPYASHDDGLDMLARIKDDDADCYAPVAFPVDEDTDNKVIDINRWAEAKANSRYANV
jgi:predicted phage terminase large subunit-like protein